MINRVHYQGLVDSDILIQTIAVFSYVIVFALSTGSSCPAFFQAFSVNIEA